MQLKAWLYTVTILLSFTAYSAVASERCSISLKPETSGFFMNPTLNKVTVDQVTPGTDGKECKLQSGDEIIQINDQPVVGQKANVVMRYWKNLGKSDPRIFRIRRNGTEMSINVR